MEAPTRGSGENVQVLVRCRPLNDRELADNQSSVVKCFDSQKQIVVQPKGSKVPSKTFYFDSVFGPERTQRDLFQSSILPIIDEVLNGYNCTIFAYGTTGTGKTFTMEGPPGSFEPLSSSATASDRVKSQREAGIIARSVQEIFDRLDRNALEYSVRVSHLELYNEDLCDLLSPGNEGVLKLLEDPRLGVQVHNLAEIPVYNPQDIFNILEKSWTERRTAETLYNKHSSRSHCIFSITIHIKESTTEGEDLIKVGKLNLVDLAGSENINRSGADKFAARKQEAGNINKSLLTLGRVITALTDGAMHIPYRESKLTRLLQDSLGGRTKTCIIATISPSSGNVEETMSTLEYAFRAKNIKNRPEVNQKMAKREVIKEYTSEINTLRAQLECMRKQSGVYLPNESYEKMLADIREAQEKILIFEEIVGRKERELEELQELFNRKSVQQEKTEKKLVETEVVLEKTKTDLQMTCTELNVTKNDLIEHKVLVAEHENVESQFHNQADIVLRTLGQAIEDTAGLFSKIERKANLANENMDKTKSFRIEMLSNLKNAENELKEFIGNVQDAFNMMDLNTSDFVTKESESMDALNHELVGFQDAIIEQSSEIGSLVVKEGQSVLKSLDRLGKVNSSFETQQLNTMKKHEEVMSSSLNSIRSTSTDLKSSVDEWSTVRLKLVHDEQDRLDKFVSSQKQLLGQFDNKVTYYTSNSSASLMEENSFLELFIQHQQEQFNQFRSQFLTTIQDTLNEFIDRQLHDTKSALDNVRSQLSKTVSQADSFKSDVSKMNLAENERLSSFQETNYQKYTELSNAIGSNLNSVHNASDEIESQIAAFEVLMSKQHSLESFKLSEQTQLMQKYLGDLSGSIQLSTTDVEVRLNQLSDDVTTRRSRLADAVHDHQGNMKLFESTWSQMVDATRDASKNFEQEAISISHATQTGVESFNLAQYQPTGITPVKKQLIYPHQLPRTRPHDEIIREFRKKNSMNNEDVESVPLSDSLLVGPSIVSDSFEQRPGTPLLEHAFSTELERSMSETLLKSSSSSLSGGSLHSSPAPKVAVVETETSKKSTLAAPAKAPVKTSTKPPLMMVNGAVVNQAPRKTSVTSTAQRVPTTSTTTKPSAAVKRTTSSTLTTKKIASNTVQGAPLSDATNRV